MRFKPTNPNSLNGVQNQNFVDVWLLKMLKLYPCVFKIDWDFMVELVQSNVSQFLVFIRTISLGLIFFKMEDSLIMSLRNVFKN
jgi:hypothetical protein